MTYQKDDMVYYAGRICKIRNVYPDKEIKYSAESRYKDAETDKIKYIQVGINRYNEPYMKLVNRGDKEQK